MKETLILTKTLLKNALNKNVDKDTLNFKTILKNIFLFLAIAYVAVVMGFLSKELIMVLKKMNQEEVFLSLCLLISVAVAFCKSILSSLNILYFSKDIEFLLPLPVSPIQIIFSKFNVMLISEYVMQLITFAIPFAVYGVITIQEPVFFVMAIFVFLTLPVIPTLLGILFTVILMRCTNFLKNKDIVQYLTVFITFAIVIAMQIFMLKTSDMTDFMFANKLLEINGVARYISEYIIILKQGMIALTELGNIEAVKNIMYLIGESITAYVLVAVLISKSYIRSATNIISGKNSKTIKKVNVFTMKSPKNAYISKEFKMLFRTPIFFLNTILPIILFPVLMGIPIFNLLGSGESEEITALISSINGNIENTAGFAICLCVINFLYMLNYISVTAISRDGENAIFMKYIPIELYKQCRYKAAPSVILNLYPLIIFLVVMRLILKEISFVFLAELFFIGFLCNLFFSYGAIIIDILRPKLHWTSEYTVVKQNLNILWDVLFIVIVTIIIFGISSFFENVHVVTFLLSGLLILTITFYDNFIKQNSINIFSKIC